MAPALALGMGNPEFRPTPSGPSSPPTPAGGSPCRRRCRRRRGCRRPGPATLPEWASAGQGRPCGSDGSTSHTGLVASTHGQDQGAWPPGRLERPRRPAFQGFTLAASPGSVSPVDASRSPAAGRPARPRATRRSAVTSSASQRGRVDGVPSAGRLSSRAPRRISRRAAAGAWSLSGRTRLRRLFSLLATAKVAPRRTRAVGGEKMR